VMGKTAGEFLQNPERRIQRDVVEKRKTPLLKREAGAQGEFTEKIRCDSDVYATWRFSGGGRVSYQSPCDSTFKDRLMLPDGCNKTTGQRRGGLLMRFV
jgi:hypothetical protein